MHPYKNSLNAIASLSTPPINNSFIHNPQLPLTTAPTLPQYPLRPWPAVLLAILAHMPALDFLLPGI